MHVLEAARSPGEGIARAGVMERGGVTALEFGPDVVDRSPALVISLDFELHWGVRDRHGPDSRYMANVRGARDAIPRLLDLFAEYDIAATWATVGFLFAESRDELESFHPEVRPRYVDTRLDPYGEPVGDGEAADPLHFAASLIRLIASTPRQEIGTHTYSHFYCLEPGADAEAFRNDIDSAVAIASAKGIRLRSAVLPRNQWNAEYARILRDAGIECFRGNQPGWMYRAAPATGENAVRRGARLADAHIPLTRWRGRPWRATMSDIGLHDVAATSFLRPVGDGSHAVNELRLRRLRAGLAQAARGGRVFHLWWHPHNFGTHTPENLSFLRHLLDHFQVLGGEYGMRSLTMLDAARNAARAATAESVDA